MLDAISTISAVVAALMMALVVRGFIYMAFRRDDTAVYYLSTGIVVVFCCAGARSFYWDTLPGIVDFFMPGGWAIWHGFIGRDIPNASFNVLWIIGSYHMLVLLWRLIPSYDRDAFSIWTAPWYPRKGMLGGIIEKLRLRR